MSECDCITKSDIRTSVRAYYFTEAGPVRLTSIIFRLPPIPTPFSARFGKNQKNTRDMERLFISEH